MEQNGRLALTRAILATAIVLVLAGCRPAPDMRDQRLAEFASQSMDRQAEQNQVIARQTQAVLEESQRIAEASKELVASDAEARQEMIAAQDRLLSQLNQQQAMIDANRRQLDQDRRELAEQRHREPIIANVIQGISLLLLCLLPLVVALYVIRRMQHDQSADAAIAELLVSDLLSSQPRLLPPASTPPKIDGPAGTNAQ